MKFNLTTGELLTPEQEARQRYLEAVRRQRDAENRSRMRKAEEARRAAAISGERMRLRGERLAADRARADQEDAAAAARLGVPPNSMAVQFDRFMRPGRLTYAELRAQERGEQIVRSAIAAKNEARRSQAERDRLSRALSRANSAAMAYRREAQSARTGGGYSTRFR